MKNSDGPCGTTSMIFLLSNGQKIKHAQGLIFLYVISSELFFS